MDRPRRDSRQHNGITLGGLSQPILQQHRRKADVSNCVQGGRGEQYGLPQSGCRRNAAVVNISSIAGLTGGGSSIA
jgi:hypothetical protein